MYEKLIVKLLTSFSPEDVITVEKLSKKLDISRTTAKNYVKKLLSLGILERMKEGYSMTRDAVKLRETILALKDRSGIAEAPYMFTDQSGIPLRLQVKSIDQLYAVFKYRLVPEKLLMHHLKQGYIQAWLRDSLGAIDLAELLDKACRISYDEVIEVLERYVALLAELSLI
ncbi:MAG: hypothetical protein DRO15_03360 [Thermoprotei archaeon]|nr:MAG: hypothetical protein DRO15_03360 [Thermoprotei archaeon]